MTVDIEVYSMTGDHMTQRGEIVEYYDILVRQMGTNDGEIIDIVELEDLSEDDMYKAVAILEKKFGAVADYIDAC